MFLELTSITLITSVLGITNSLHYKEGNFPNNVNLQNNYYEQENPVKSGFMPEEHFINELNRRINRGRRTLNNIFKQITLKPKSSADINIKGKDLYAVI